MLTSLPNPVPAGNVSDSKFTLLDGEVHVWHGSLLPAADVGDLAHLLSPDETQRAARFKFEEDRRRFVVARARLRQLIAAYLGTTPEQLKFVYGANGKPALSPEFCTHDIHFNLSHSRELVAIALTRGRQVGIDVEFIREDLDVDKLARRFFSICEQNELAKLSGPEMYQGFFNCWTRKEACIKAQGSGVPLGLRDFDVTLAPGAAADLLATRPDSKAASQWSMTSLSLHADYAAAVAVQKPCAKVTVMQFESHFLARS